MDGYGIIGCGRIARRLAGRLSSIGDAPDLVAMLVRPAHLEAATALAGRDAVCTTLDAFVLRRPAVAVEASSAAALAQYGPALLAAGIDLIPLSLTALAEVETERRLIAAAEAGPGRLEIAPGAVGTLDLLATAREEGLQRVVYRQLKSPAMWKLTPASHLADLDAFDARGVFFRGTVREVARHLPNNLNTSVGVALAGLGLDRTEAELVADPALRETAHELDIHAAAGNALIRIAGREVAPAGDPVDHTTFSVMRLLRRRRARVAI